MILLFGWDIFRKNIIDFNILSGKITSEVFLGYVKFIRASWLNEAESSGVFCTRSTNGFNASLR